ncbi:MAG: riboflavin synthase [Deltaproteobacteria bacterium]|nr:riboflavin synthase [Deltaproteobacteria bacterium]
MFTGIVEDVGVVESVGPGPGGGRTLIVRTGLDPASLAIGDSVAVSGVCLTLVRVDGARFTVEAGPETLARTTTGGLAVGSRINLERALTLSARLGGHLVQGHVDGVGEVEAVIARENAYDLRIRSPLELMPLIAPRGSITVDGISLTVTGVDAATFGVSIIPHTWRVTTLRDRAPGAGVNLEVDLLARYVARLLAAGGTPGPGITEAFLKSHGFA